MNVWLNFKQLTAIESDREAEFIIIQSNLPLMMCFDSNLIGIIETLEELSLCLYGKSVIYRVSILVSCFSVNVSTILVKSLIRRTSL
jgi:hypothetical protein